MIASKPLELLFGFHRGGVVSQFSTPQRIRMRCYALLSQLPSTALKIPFLPHNWMGLTVWDLNYKQRESHDFKSLTKIKEASVDEIVSGVCQSSQEDVKKKVEPSEEVGYSKCGRKSGHL